MLVLPAASTLGADTILDRMNEEARQEHLAEMNEGFNREIIAILKKANVPSPLLTVEVSKCPKEIRNLGIFGRFPKEGFGLIGPSGCGKSAAHVVAIKNYIQLFKQKAGPFLYTRDEASRIVSHKPKDLPRIIWIDWPRRSRMIRNAISTQQWSSPEACLQEIDLIADGKPCIVVVDDIGREMMREKKGKAQDELEMLVSELYNQTSSRLLWSSNLSLKEIEAAYGSPFTSRLIGCAIDVDLPKHLPDLRIM